MTKMKILLTEKKILYYKESITFQSKYCKVVLHKTECFIPLKESLMIKKMFFL